MTDDDLRALLEERFGPLPATTRELAARPTRAVDERRRVLLELETGEPSVHEGQ